MAANASFALTGLRCNVRFTTSGRFCQIVSVKEFTTYLVQKAAEKSAAFLFFVGLDTTLVLAVLDGQR